MIGWIIDKLIDLWINVLYYTFTTKAERKMWNG